MDVCSNISARRNSQIQTFSQTNGRDNFIQGCPDVTLYGMLLGVFEMIEGTNI